MVKFISNNKVLKWIRYLRMR